MIKRKTAAAIMDRPAGQDAPGLGARERAARPAVPDRQLRRFADGVATKHD